MQPFDSRIIALLPILMLAPFAHTSHRAVKSRLSIEFPGLQFQIGMLPLFMKTKSITFLPNKLFDLKQTYNHFINFLLVIRRLHAPHLLAR